MKDFEPKEFSPFQFDLLMLRMHHYMSESSYVRLQQSESKLRKHKVKQLLNQIHKPINEASDIIFKDFTVNDADFFNDIVSKGERLLEWFICLSPEGKEHILNMVQFYYQENVNSKIMYNVEFIGSLQKETYLKEIQKIDENLKQEDLPFLFIETFKNMSDEEVYAFFKEQYDKSLSLSNNSPFMWDIGESRHKEKEDGTVVEHFVVKAYVEAKTDPLYIRKLKIKKNGTN